MDNKTAFDKLQTIKELLKEIDSGKKSVNHLLSAIHQIDDMQILIMTEKESEAK